MAQAKKCDICGKLYELYNTRNNSENVNGYMFLNIDGDRRYFSHSLVECCPECINSIKLTIDNLSKGLETRKGDEIVRTLGVR